MTRRDTHVREAPNGRPNPNPRSRRGYEEEALRPRAPATATVTSGLYALKLLSPGSGPVKNRGLFWVGHLPVGQPLQFARTCGLAFVKLGAQQKGGGELCASASVGWAAKWLLTRRRPPTPHRDSARGTSGQRRIPLGRTPALPPCTPGAAWPPQVAMPLGFFGYPLFASVLDTVTAGSLEELIACSSWDRRRRSHGPITDGVGSVWTAKHTWRSRGRRRPCMAPRRNLPAGLQRAG